MNEKDLKIAQERLSDRHWRLNNLYYIQNKQGEKQLFQLNWAQEQLYNDMWYLNCVLKARQLGISTFITLLFLDTALFNSDVSCGIVADNEENAKYIFRKIKFAYDCLPDELKSLRAAKNDSSKELTFSNNSLIRVGTSLRSATFQYLLVSEFGKICAEDLKRANEIVTGSLNTIAKGQYVFIESTAKGRSGAFYELCKQAQANNDSKIKLTPLDFRFHFYSWHQHKEYSLDPYGVVIPKDLQEYFQELEDNEKIVLSPDQKAWYSKKFVSQGMDMKREFPSTPEEAFESAHEGLFYAELITRARKENRIRKVYYDETQPVFSAWDLGFSDDTSIWIYQLAGQEIHLLDYIEDNGKPFTYYLKLIKNKDYCFSKHFAPHDIAQHEYSTGMTRLEIAKNNGVNFTIAPNLSIIDGIDAVRGILNRSFFDEEKCAKGIKALESYRRAWDEKNGCWKEGAVHDWSSHCCDAFRMLAISLPQSKTGMTADDTRRMRDQYLSGRGLYAQSSQIPQANPFARY